MPAEDPQVFTVDGSYLPLFEDPIVLTEKATAPAAQANKAVIYAIDNGAGKTQLMVRFATGAAVQIAIEP